MGRYLVVVAAFVLAMTSVASGVERYPYARVHWRTVKVHHYVGTCRCGRHLCGTTWWQGGTLHRCRKLR